MVYNRRHSSKVINTAIATADTPLSGDDATLSVTSNEAVVDIAPIPSIAITKTSSVVQVDTGNTTIDVGDQISYTIVVTNDGNTALTGVDITDTLTAIGGASLSLDAVPVFVSSTDANTTFTNDTSTSVPTLLVGEAVTFQQHIQLLRLRSMQEVYPIQQVLLDMIRMEKRLVILLTIQ